MKYAAAVFVVLTLCSQSALAQQTSYEADYWDTPEYLVEEAEEWERPDELWEIREDCREAGSTRVREAERWEKSDIKWRKAKKWERPDRIVHVCRP